MSRRSLLALYPAWWRQRYEEEARAILEEAPLTVRGALDIVRGAIDAWLRQRPPREGFARFTDEARQVVVCAQDEARDLRHNYLGTEHILLGLLAAREGVAARTLAAFGLSPELVRARIVQVLGAGSPTPAKCTRKVVDGDSWPAASWMCCTPRTKRGFEMARREAEHLGHDRVGPEHLLLGLLKEGEGVGVLVLRELGADPDSVREQLARLTGS
ncbi:MAG: Clp protease N-terminal domain-containing protein [Thermomicrobiales bacterium]